MMPSTRTIVEKFLGQTSAPVLVTDVALLCVLGAIVSAIVLGLRRTPMWAVISAQAWTKAFAAFLFVYAIQILDRQNGDVGVAEFVLVAIVGIWFVSMDLSEKAGS